MDFFIRELHAQRDTRNLNAAAMTLINLVAMHVDRSPELAVKYEEEAVQFFRQTGYVFGQGMAQRAIAGAAWKTDPTRALREYERAIELFRVSRSDVEIGKTLWDYAKLLRQLGEHDAAVSNAKQAVELLDAVDAPKPEKVRAEMKAWKNPMSK